MTTEIPNNVDLDHDRQLRRALAMWHPHYLDWWRGAGPDGFDSAQVYLRTAISVSPEGWANYGLVRMRDYRWGIFLAPEVTDRKIGFGDQMGDPVWQQIPGEYRKDLRRIIVTQADTEPASVEQNRLLGQTAPSLYDLRNIFQLNCEEGRHLWAMVYLLQKYFGRDGREEAAELLQRRSGNPDHPRILNAFNAPVRDWLDYFCFSMFSDRDGKYQLAALAESAFDPLSRTTRFMLTEEAFHMFVGESGIQRVIARAADVMAASGRDDLFELGAVPLAVLQKYINYWYTEALDLFGGEDSSNAATWFAAGLKGRFQEEDQPEHLALDQGYELRKADGTVETIAMRRAMNAVLRDAFVKDCQRGLKRWNRELEHRKLDARIYLPAISFNRKVGALAAIPCDPEGGIITQEEFARRRDEWLPTEEDRLRVAALMKPVYEPGKIASWLTPPVKGVGGKPALDFEYVRFD